MARKNKHTNNHLKKTFDDQEFTEETSKSQLKREMNELQKLGEKLEDVAQSTLEKVINDPLLFRALIESKGIKSHIAKKRQLKFIGKLLSKTDEANRQAINELIDNKEGSSLKTNQYFHQLEQWRDKLLKQQDTAINALLEIYPDLDRNELRQLVRNAQKEKEHNKPPKNARLIFQFLKQHIPL